MGIALKQKTDFNLVRYIVGLDRKVPLLGGGQRTYINFDNAASTPIAKPVMDVVNQFAPWYSSVHRGSGFKSQLATQAYDEARQIVLKFFGANESDHVVIFGKNTTEAINKLSYRLNLAKDDVVLVGLTEHHSNDLPWRKQAKVIHININKQGTLLLSDLAAKLAKYGSRVKLVAISGGSNVTGAMPDLAEAARLVHAAGSKLFVDCAQLAPHRRISLGRLGSNTHIDYIAVSAHKMYAPFGTGALIGRKDTFETGTPELCGGGTIAVVTEDKVEWAPPPDRDEAGSPNVIGAVAFARALQFLDHIGMDTVAEHEADLTAYLLTKLSNNKSLQIYGDTNPASAARRLGVITFNIKGYHPGLVSAILSAEWGIGVRSGCFCAHPYVTRLLGMTKQDINKFREVVLSGDRRDIPGMVRVSFGVYNSRREIDLLAEALTQIAAGAYEGAYRQDKISGEFSPENWRPDLSAAFSL